MDDVNPNGGGISLGHPLGATGARITATLLNELERRDARYGIATMCIGFGQAIAAVIERGLTDSDRARPGRRRVPQRVAVPRLSEHRGLPACSRRRSLSRPRPESSRQGEQVATRPKATNELTAGPRRLDERVACRPPVSIALVIRRVGVVGLGDDGRRDRPGRVAGRLRDRRPRGERRARRARAREIEHYLGRAVEKGRLTAEERDAALGRLTLDDRARRSRRLRPRDRGDRRGARAEARALRRARPRSCAPDAILATNTSALSVDRDRGGDRSARSA